MNDETKLPKWTKELLQSLRQKIHELEEEIVIFRQECPKSNTAFQVHNVNLDEIYLPNRSLVRFYFGPVQGDGRQYYVEAYALENHLQINGENAFVVQPQASNAIAIAEKK